MSAHPIGPDPFETLVLAAAWRVIAGGEVPNNHRCYRRMLASHGPCGYQAVKAARAGLIGRGLFPEPSPEVAS